MHNILSAMCIISHLVLHYWLVLELLQAEILLVGSAHVSGLHELLTLIPSCVFLLFHWNFDSLILEILLNLTSELSFFLA